MLSINGHLEYLWIALPIRNLVCILLFYLRSCLCFERRRNTVFHISSVYREQPFLLLTPVLDLRTVYRMYTLIEMLSIENHRDIHIIHKISKRKSLEKVIYLTSHLGLLTSITTPIGFISRLIDSISQCNYAWLDNGT